MRVEPLDGDKAAWRSWASRLPPHGEDEHRAVVDGVRRFLLAQPITGRVLVYRFMPGEVDVDLFLEEFSCAVTRTWPAGRLTVHAADVAMERHRWGYEQPVAGAPELEIREIGAVLVPGVLFDRFGGRLGHGAGYYDRLLPTLRPGIPLIGVAVQVLDVRLPMDPHDVRMTHLADSSGVVAAVASSGEIRATP